MNDSSRGDPYLDHFRSEQFFFETPMAYYILMFENPNIDLYFPFRALLSSSPSSSLHAWYAYNIVCHTPVRLFEGDSEGMRKSRGVLRKTP